MKIALYTYNTSTIKLKIYNRYCFDDVLNTVIIKFQIEYMTIIFVVRLLIFCIFDFLLFFFLNGR